jgi:hypothetical protein
MSAPAAESADVQERYAAEAREAKFHLQYALRLASKPIAGYTLHADDAGEIARVLDYAAHLIAKARLTPPAGGPLH